MLCAPPEKIVVEFLGTRSLEGIDLATLRVHAGHDVLDGSIFSGRVHALKDEQQCGAILGVELVLKLRHGRDATLENFSCLLLRAQWPGVAGVKVFEAELP